MIYSRFCPSATISCPNNLTRTWSIVVLLAFLRFEVFSYLHNSRGRSVAELVFLPHPSAKTTQRHFSVVVVESGEERPLLLPH